MALSHFTSLFCLWSLQSCLWAHSHQNIKVLFSLFWKHPLASTLRNLPYLTSQWSLSHFHTIQARGFSNSTNEILSPWRRTQVIIPIYRFSCAGPEMSQSPTCFTVNTFQTILSCLKHQHWPRRHNSPWLCKIEICFMCLKLIFIFLGYCRHKSYSISPTLLSSFHVTVSHAGCSQAQAQAQAQPQPPPPLTPSFHTHAYSHQLLLRLSSSAPLAPPFLSSKVSYPDSSTRPRLKMALELERGWLWQPVAPKLGGTPELQQEETKHSGQEGRNQCPCGFRRTKTWAGISA